MRLSILIATVIALLITSCSEGQSIPDSLVGTNGRLIIQDWLDIESPGTQNTKMMTFQQIKAEVDRAAGINWTDQGVDQWELSKSVLRFANYIDNWQSNRIPSQQKQVTLRKMAYKVCEDLVLQDAGQPTRTFFTEVDPALPIDTTAASVATQVESIYQRIHLVAPTTAETTDALALLTELQTLADSQQAWRGFCAGQLMSMRFLTY